MSENPLKKPIRLPVWLKILLVFALTLLASIGYLKNYLSHQDAEVASDLDESLGEKREPMAPVSFKDSSGQNFSIKDAAGKVTIISFWASWCGPCLEELPTFAKLQKKLGSEKLLILPVNLDKAEVAATFIPRFWKKHDLEFKTFFDPEQSAVQTLSIDVLPSNFVIDKKGRQVLRADGAVDWNNEQIVSQIEQLVNEKN